MLYLVNNAMYYEWIVNYEQTNISKRIKEY